MPSKKGEGLDKHSHAHGLPVRNAITKGCEMKLTVNGVTEFASRSVTFFNPNLRGGGGTILLEKFCRRLKIFNRLKFY